MLFKNIPGLEESKAQLIQAVKNNHVAHAQMFLGQPGGGNLAMALAFATYLNCDNPGDEDACGVCPTCQKNQKFIHPDVHFVFPVGATKKVTGSDVVSTSFLKEWRGFLLQSAFGNLEKWAEFFGGENKQLNISKEESRQIIKQLALKSYEGKYKIMVIWHPENMNISSANGILKILEEPPAKTVFLLVGYDLEKIISTIISRTQIFNIPPFEDEAVQGYVLEHFEVDDGKAKQIAHLAKGDINVIEELISGVENNSHEWFRDWMRGCFTKDLTKLVKLSDQFHGMNKVAQKSVLHYALQMFRESLLKVAGNEDMLRLTGAESTFIENFSKVMDFDKIAVFVQEIEQDFYYLERNASAKMIFLDLSLKIARQLR